MSRTIKKKNLSSTLIYAYMICVLSQVSSNYFTCLLVRDSLSTVQSLDIGNGSYCLALKSLFFSKI